MFSYQSKWNVSSDWFLWYLTRNGKKREIIQKLKCMYTTQSSGWTAPASRGYYFSGSSKHNLSGAKLYVNQIWCWKGGYNFTVMNWRWGIYLSDKSLQKKPEIFRAIFTLFYCCYCSNSKCENNMGNGSVYVVDVEGGREVKVPDWMSPPDATRGTGINGHHQPVSARRSKCAAWTFPCYFQISCNVNCE